MSLSSEELNFLIYRYLRESGFEHTAYSFMHESFLHRSSLSGDALPTGALINYVQKGLQYEAIETHLHADGCEIVCDEQFSVLKPHQCRLTQNAEQQQLHSHPSLHHHLNSMSAVNHTLTDSHTLLASLTDTDFGKLEIDAAIHLKELSLNGSAHSSAHAQNGLASASSSNPLATLCLCWSPHTASRHYLVTGGADGRLRVTQLREKIELLAKTEGQQAKKTNRKLYKLMHVIDTVDHTSDELNAKSEPQDSDALLPPVKRQKFEQEPIGSPNSSAADTTAAAANQTVSSTALAISSGNHAVTCCAWSPSQSDQFCCGTYSGRVHSYSSKTAARPFSFRPQPHSRPITCCKYSRTGRHVAFASIDSTVSIYNAQNGELICLLQCHAGPVLDLDWLNDDLIASGSVDGSAFVCNISGATSVAPETPQPHATMSESHESVKRLSGHTSDVNSVCFDPSGTFLATASDDSTIRIYSVRHAYALIAVLKEHVRAVTMIRFSPNSGMHSSSANNGFDAQLQSMQDSSASGLQPILLASASADTSVKIWNLSDASLDPMTSESPDSDLIHCVHTLVRHIHPVTHLAWQPGSALLLSASHERLHIWSTVEGVLVRTFKSEGTGACTQAEWDTQGRRIAAGYEDSFQYVLDLKQ